MSRRTWTPAELRDLAKTEPSPMLPHLLDTLRQALMYAADVMEAADAVIAERSGASAQPADGSKS